MWGGGGGGTWPSSAVPVLAFEKVFIVNWAYQLVSPQKLLYLSALVIFISMFGNELMT